MLCAQSPVFKTMLDSDLWAESRNKEVSVLLHERMGMGNVGPRAVVFHSIKLPCSPNSEVEDMMLLFLLLYTVVDMND